MKALILGGTGMLGAQCTWEGAVRLGSKECDIMHQEQVETSVEQHQPDVVVLLAAISVLATCERTPDRAHRVNALGPAIVALACRRFKVKLVYMSTTAVFPDTAEQGLNPWRANQEIRDLPPNVYGYTKLLGERLVLSQLPNALVVRPGWMIGGGNGVDQKFVPICYNALRSGKEYTGYTNHYGSPTYVPDMWDAIYNLIEQCEGGVVHIANAGAPVSRYDVAHYVKEKADLPGTLHKEAIRRDHNGYIATENQAIVSSVHLRPWQEAAEEYIETLRREYTNGAHLP